MEYKDRKTSMLKRIIGRKIVAFRANAMFLYHCWKQWWLDHRGLNTAALWAAKTLLEVCA
jgi:hypothetical protein